MSRLLDQVEDTARLRGMSDNTVRAYRSWTVAYVRFHDLTHPNDLDAQHVRAFLTTLARELAPSTVNQAHAALSFLYVQVLRDPPAGLELVPWARTPTRVPTVLSRDEVRRLLAEMPPRSRLAASLLYGSGLRISEALSLRVKDLDLDRFQVIIHEGKGRKDRVGVLPKRLVDPLGQRLAQLRLQHGRDIARDAGWVELPGSMAHKAPANGRRWPWQWVFCSQRAAAPLRYPHDRGRGGAAGAAATDGPPRRAHDHALRPRGPHRARPGPQPAGPPPRPTALEVTSPAPYRRPQPWQSGDPAVESPHSACTLRPWRRRVDWVVLGNPDNRRVTGFVEAVRTQGDTLRAVVPWRAFLDDPDALRAVSDAPAMLRLESAGEDDRVHRALLRRGGAPEVRPRFGELVAPAATHRGLLWALQQVREVLDERPQWTPLATPERIATVFDKAALHEVCTDLGVRVPERLRVTSVDDLLAQLQAEPRTVFVKLRHGSSASGLGVYTPGPRPRLMTTVRVTPEGRFNSLKVNRVTDLARIRALLAWLLSEGAQVEVAVPKPQLDGAFFDCRVLMVDHEPTFVVVRQSRHVITNLHLGGWRGSVEALREACPEAVWEAAMDDCRRVSRWYGGLHLGLDLLIERGFRWHRILEANAFGDLLPRLTEDGLSVYAYEVVASRNWSPGP